MAAECAGEVCEVVEGGEVAAAVLRGVVLQLGLRRLHDPGLVLRRQEAQWEASTRTRPPSTCSGWGPARVQWTWRLSDEGDEVGEHEAGGVGEEGLRDEEDRLHRLQPHPLHQLKRPCPALNGDRGRDQRGDLSEEVPPVGLGLDEGDELQLRGSREGRRLAQQPLPAPAQPCPTRPPPSAATSSESGP